MKKKPTKAESEHMGQVVELGCIVCLNLGHPGTPCCYHHLRHQVGAGRRSPHKRGIGLCPWHHTDGPYGEAFHKGKVAWERKYGTELQLLEQTRRLLGETEDAG